MSRKHILPTFLFLYFSVIIFNYPGLFYPGQHQGTDSWGNSSVSTSIIENGYDLRFRHLLSFFGLSPYSNSMGAAFLLSGLSICTGLDVFDSILVLSSFFFTTLAFFGMFLISRNFLESDVHSLLASFVFLTTRIMLAFTRWEYSYRGPYVCFFIVFLVIFFHILRPNIVQIRKTKEMVIGFLLLVILSTIHQMFYFNMLLFVALLIFLSYNYFSRYVPASSSLVSLASDFRFKLSIIMFLYLFSLFGYTFYERNTIITDEVSITIGTFFDSIYTLIRSYASRFGLLFVFVPVGMIVLSMNNKRMYQFLFILLSTYSLVFFDTSYALMTLLPFLAILSVKGFFGVTNLFVKRKYKAEISIILIIIVAAIVPEYVVFTNKEIPVDEETLASGATWDKTDEQRLAEGVGLYIKNSAHYPIVSQGIVSASAVNAYSNVAAYRYSMYIPIYSSEASWINTDMDKFLTAEDQYLFMDDGPSGFSLTRVLFSPEGKDSFKTELEIKKLSNYNSTSFLVLTYSPSPISVQHEEGYYVDSVFLVSIYEETYNLYVGEYHTVNILIYPE